LRDDEAEIRRRDTQVVCVAPSDLAECQAMIARFPLPFPVLADPDRHVFASYDVQSRVWSLGQRPGVFLIDRDGIIRWVHLGTQQWHIPSREELFAVLDGIEVEPREPTARRDLTRESRL
jgi:peroxiredoxin Q/BCP